MTRRAGVLLALVVVLLTGCRPDDGWHPSAPFAPSLRPAFGARVTDGKLQIWTGSRCIGVRRVGLFFGPDKADMLVDSTSPSGTEIEHLTVGGPYPAGLEVAQPLPDGFEWRLEKSLTLAIKAESATWGSTTELDEVREGSKQHPEDTYWFQGVGWLNPAEVAVQDGKTFLATCTADPAKKG